MHVLVNVHYLCNPRAIGAVTQVSPSFSALSEIVLHVYRLSEGPVWLHHLRHHQLPRPFPGLRSRKLSASSSSEVPPCLHPLTLLQLLHTGCPQLRAAALGGSRYDRYEKHKVLFGFFSVCPSCSSQYLASHAALLQPCIVPSCISHG